MICRAAEGRGLPVGELPRGLVNLWLTKSSEHQVIATEPEQAEPAVAQEAVRCHARAAFSFKLTETREITPYVWAHPDEER